MKREYKIQSVPELYNLASEFMIEHLSEIKESGVVLLLQGDFGAGKTEFVRGIAKYLEIDEIIKSPSYVYVYEYDVDSEDVKKLVHYDLWRVDSKEVLDSFQLNNQVKAGVLLAVEWPENLELEIEESSVYKIDFSVDADNTRTLQIDLLSK